jgi:type IV secretory pathway protease TraF
MRALRYVVPSVAIVLLADVAGYLVNPQTMVYRNVTKSMPLGWYVRNPVGAPTKGAIIAFHPPAIALAYRWPADVPLLKRVAAVGGDKVCSDGKVLAVNDVTVGRVLDRLPNGHLLPVWKGCQVLPDDQVFPIATGIPDSFDGRAYGPIKTADVIGVFLPVWTLEGGE